MKKIMMVILTLVILLSKMCVYAKEDISITSTSAILIEKSTKRVLYAKDERKKVKIASTTKVLTAIVAVENASLKDKVVISKNAASVGGSTIGLKKGDEVTLEALMYGMLLKSGNDCAVAIAEHIAGSTEEFAKMMNKKAYEIGAKDTVCTNPHGLDTDKNYSTAYDLALIMCYASNNEDISKIIGTKSITVNFGSTPKYLANTNRLLSTYEYCTGGKTGFTNGANRCLVATAKKEDLELVAVILGAETTNIRFSETKKLLEYGVQNYTMTDVSDKINWYIDIPIIKGNIKSYTKKFNISQKLPLKENEIEEIYLSQNILPVIEAPESRGLYVGNIQLKIKNEVLYNKDIYLEEDIKKNNVLDYILVGLKQILTFNLAF